jgi:hypothetical protein
MVKTSITLKEKTLQAIEEYRATKRPIPTRSEAIEELLNKILKEDKKTKRQEAKETAI